MNQSTAPPVERLTWAQVRAWRVTRQHLVDRVPAKRMLEVVAEVCGVHAQVPSSADLQIWARVADVEPQDVREALWERRSLVRTWCMRGTLHLLTADDLPLYVAALRTHDRWWKGAWLRVIGCSAEELRAILDAIRDSLGDRPLTREQLAAEVARRVGPHAQERMLSGWGEMLKPAAFQGSLIGGPPQGQNVTFVSPAAWLPEWKELGSEQAWREIVRRYLRAYGPAAREEFGRWWGMQPAPAGRVLAASADELAAVEVEGYRAWALAEDLAGMRADQPGAPARLLPGFDVYVAGTRPRASLVEKRFEDRVFRQAGWVSPVVLVDGMVAGVWGHERSGGRIQVTVEPFQRLSGEQRRQLGGEADRLGSFLGAAASISYSC
jgi:Winged helix DNA-binding domain